MSLRPHPRLALIIPLLLVAAVLDSSSKAEERTPNAGGAVEDLTFAQSEPSVQQRCVRVAESVTFALAGDRLQD